MMSFSLCQENKSSLQGRLFTKLKSYYIVAVKHIDSSLFQGNNSAEIPMAIRQTKTSLELPMAIFFELLDHLQSHYIYFSELQ
jgi:hypothetical protein